MPYLMSRTGALVGAAVLLAALGVSAVLHLMLADMLLVEPCGLTILPIFRRFLFRGKAKRFLTGLFFLLLCVVLAANLAAYIAGGGEIIASLLGPGDAASRILFYLVALVPPVLGLKAIGASEKAGVALMAGLILLLAVLSFQQGRQPMDLRPQGGRAVVALYGGIMFCLSALFAVPQAVEGLAGNRKQIRRAIALGLSLNTGMTLVLSVSALRASKTVTQVAIVGWSAALGRPVQLLASFFVLLAMLTSFWAIAFALSEMAGAVMPRLRGFSGMAAVTLPSLLLTLFGGGFLSFISLTGGAVAVIVALLLLPAYRSSRKEAVSPPLLGNICEHRWFALLIGLGYLLMAVGSVLSI